MGGVTIRDLYSSLPGGDAGRGRQPFQVLCRLAGPRVQLLHQDSRGALFVVCDNGQVVVTPLKDGEGAVRLDCIRSGVRTVVWGRGYFRSGGMLSPK